MRGRAAGFWVVAVLMTALAWCAPAGAVQVSGSLEVTGTTAVAVSFSFTAQRTCAAEEQCDYFSEVDQLRDTSACPSEHPAGPYYILWTGQLQNTGPTTEKATATPRGWATGAPIGPSRLCLYTYAEGTYTLVADAVATQGTGGAPPPSGPAPPGGGLLPVGSQPPGGGGSGSGSGGGGDTTKPGGKTAPVSAACKPYIYQQTAQKALDKDPKLAGKLDPDGNGVACDTLPKRKTYISTVGLREASKATRAALRKTRGTAFTKGTGYRAHCKRTTRTRVRCSVTWRHGGKWTGYVDVIGALRKNKRVTITHVHVIRPF